MEKMTDSRHGIILTKKVFGAAATPAVSVTLLTKVTKSRSTSSYPYAIRMDIAPVSLFQFSSMYWAGHFLCYTYPAVSRVKSLGVFNRFFKKRFASADCAT